MPQGLKPAKVARFAALRSRCRRLLLPVLTGLLTVAWAGFLLSFFGLLAADHRVILPGMDWSDPGIGPLTNRWQLTVRAGVLEFRSKVPPENPGFISGAWDEGRADYRVFLITGEDEPARMIWCSEPGTPGTTYWVWRYSDRRDPDELRMSGFWPLWRNASTDKTAWWRIELWPLLVAPSLWVGLGWRRRWLMNRVAAGRCVRCGYSLAGLSADAKCPECGAFPRNE